jgi:hypothetical protein
MENQHRKIKGYRELCQDEIDLMNNIKEKGELFGQLIEDLKSYHSETGGDAIDMKWLSDGEMQLKKGIMSLVRSVAQPGSF